MKKIVFLLLCFLMISNVAALVLQDNIKIAPAYTNAIQYYSVHFDGEGEAYVTLRIDLTNKDTQDITSLNVEIPGEQVSLLAVIQQQTQTQVCVDWITSCLEYTGSQTCIEYDYSGNCLKYEQPCANAERICNRYQTNYNPIFKKLDVEPVTLSNSLSVPIDLAIPIGQNGYTQLLLVYKVEDYSSNFLGLNRFDFETAKLPIETQSVRVAVNVDSDMHLKGSNSNVNYRSNFETLESMAVMGSYDGKAMDQIAGISNSISYAYGYVKSASYLDPLESFTVKGSYSSSWLSCIGLIFYYGF